MLSSFPPPTASAAAAVHFPQSLSRFPTPLLRLRFHLLQLFNTSLVFTLPVFQMHSILPPALSTGQRIRGMPASLFPCTVDPFLGQALAKTAMREKEWQSTVEAGRAAWDSEDKIPLYPSYEEEGGGNYSSSGSGGSNQEDIHLNTLSRSPNMFAQSFQVLGNSPSASFRRYENRRDVYSKVFKVRFLGQEGEDAGGLYREALTRMVGDLFSKSYPLFTPCLLAPGQGDASSLFVPSPTLAGHPLAAAQLEFVGRLCGLSIRSRASLPFQFPSVLWTALQCSAPRMLGEVLTGDEISGGWEVEALSAHLSSMDWPLALTLARVRMCARHATWDESCGGGGGGGGSKPFFSGSELCQPPPIQTESEFQQAFPGLVWAFWPLGCEVRSAGTGATAAAAAAASSRCGPWVPPPNHTNYHSPSSYQPHELAQLCEVIPGGAFLPVHFSDRLRWATAMESTALRTLSKGVEAIRRGLGAQIPLEALTLIPSRSLEKAVCGTPDVDATLLERHTVYRGAYSAGHPVIKRFWRVFRERLSPALRVLYVRFAWGARMPNGSNWHGVEHTLEEKSHESGSSPDLLLPSSHTCFFSVELPAYTTDEKMLWGLTWAAHSSGHVLDR